ncbi:MAG TPA: TlyA family RNA methyltransferase [Microbacteriaceae bacterium]|nr:TlyA family RNA methyltransferase [Microbacteriaceae bacterium]
MSGSPGDAGSAARLDVELVTRGLARSRNHAATLIRAGRVSVDGRALVKASASVTADQTIEVDSADAYVSRAAHKLVGALDAFDIDPTGLVCLDAGASTGGFSQVLIERGAALVIAVDVGHGQLSPALESEIRAGRLVSLEGVNVRELTPGTLEPHLGGRAIGLVVADLSFISLTLVLPALTASAPGADLVVLVKPQFEVGRGGVREGIVRDAKLRVEAVEGVLWAAHDAGLGVAGLAASPILGTHGNVEFLALLSPGRGGSPSEWTARIAELAGG